MTPLRLRLLAALTALFLATPTFAQDVPPKIWDVPFGTPIDSLGIDFAEPACGTNGGPPSITLASFSDYTQCPTEAGGLRSGTVKSAVGLGMLLAEGIGDTIRISLAADPVEEVKVGFDILKSLHLRSRGINFIACPSCSRQNFDVVKTMNELEGRLEDLLVPMDVAVIGCVVNGPGEAKEAHIGLTGGTPNNLVYIDGKPAQKLNNDNLVDELERLIREKAAAKAEADAALIARS